MDIKIIKNEAEYEAAMARLLAMIESNPEASGEAGDEI
jgi:antitoxin component HigA of HigAB toxin-antitoxin module